MAIDCEIETEYGTGFKYHKIVDVHLIYSNDWQLRITTDSWLNKDCRISGKKPVRTVNIIDNMDFALTPFYQILKMKFPAYKDGEDDFDDSWKEPIEKKECEYSVQSENNILDHWQDHPEDPVEENKDLRAQNDTEIIENEIDEGIKIIEE